MHTIGFPLIAARGTDLFKEGPGRLGFSLVWMIHLSGKLLKFVFCETIYVQPVKLSPSEIYFGTVLALKLNPSPAF